MRKYIIFSISFIVMFLLIQVLSGMIITFMYTPDVESAWNMSAPLAEEMALISRQSSFLLTSLAALFSALIAFFVQKRVTRSSNN